VKIVSGGYYRLDMRGSKVYPWKYVFDVTFKTMAWTSYKTVHFRSIHQDGKVGAPQHCHSAWFERRVEKGPCTEEQMREALGLLARRTT